MLKYSTNQWAANFHFSTINTTDVSGAKSLYALQGVSRFISSSLHLFDNFSTISRLNVEPLNLKISRGAQASALRVKMSHSDDCKRLFFRMKRIPPSEVQKVKCSNNEQESNIISDGIVENRKVLMQHRNGRYSLSSCERLKKCDLAVLLDDGDTTPSNRDRNLTISPVLDCKSALRSRPFFF